MSQAAWRDDCMEGRRRQEFHVLCSLSRDEPRRFSGQRFSPNLVVDAPSIVLFHLYLAILEHRFAMDIIMANFGISKAPMNYQLFEDISSHPE